MRRLLLFAALAMPAAAQPDVDVEGLLRKMTLEEKVGQMQQLAEGGAVTGPGGKTIGLEELIRQGRAGSVLNAVGYERIRKLQKVAVEESRLKIPLLFGLDVIHGYRTIFPIPLAEACSWDLQAIESSARIAAREAASTGLHWTFAPMVDVARDPRWGRIAEGAGEDTYLGSRIAAARVRGFQGPDLKSPERVVACVKHYAAYGAAQAGRDYNTVDLSPRTLHEVYLPPYKAALDAGARTVMTAFNEYDGTPCTINRYLLTDVLRRQWGFQGLVVSDWASLEQAIDHGAVADQKDASRQGALAGLDMEMATRCYADHLVQQVKNGEVPEKAVDDAVRHILQVKADKGLFANPYVKNDAPLMSPENQNLAREVARKSIVLLKHDPKLLPLAKGKIALVGPLAADRKNMLGTWACQGEAEECVSIKDALQERKLHIVHAKGCDIESQDRSGFAQAVQAAREADVIVAVMGESNDMSGEASSRANPVLPGLQRELLKELKATGKPLVLLLFNGRPLVLDWEDANADAIVECWQLGTQAGRAVADVLLGDVSPSGRLVATFPRHVGQIPLFYNHFNTGRPYARDNHFTSHYLDVPNTPLYPFGYGLSYTTFRYSPLKIDGLDVRCTITNTGTRAAEETAQLYVRDLVGSVNRPVRELKGFRKVHLQPGQSQEVTFRLKPEDLAFYRKDMSFGPEPGEFRVWVGPHSRAGSEGTIRL